MGRFLFPLVLIGLGGIGLVEHAAINDEMAAVYPSDAAQQTALSRCTQEEGMMKRFSASGRAACYLKYLPTDVAPTAPAVTVGIPGAQPASPPAHAVPHAPTVHTNTNQR
jgi:hypothetical protein